MNPHFRQYSEAVAARLHLEHALSGAQQPRLDHPGHDRVARAVFLVVIPQRLGLVQPDLLALRLRVRLRLVAAEQLHNLRLVHAIGQAYASFLRQLAQLHDRHALNRSYGFHLFQLLPKGHMVFVTA